MKERVYEPDWRTGERVSFTRDAADVLAAHLPVGGFGSISTVPGGFMPVGRDPKAVAALVDHLLQAAAHLVVIERRAATAFGSRPTGLKPPGTVEMLPKPPTSWRRFCRSAASRVKLTRSPVRQSGS